MSAKAKDEWLRGQGAAKKLASSPTDWSRFDHLVDSDDEDGGPEAAAAAAATEQPDGTSNMFELPPRVQHAMAMAQAAGERGDMAGLQAAQAVVEAEMAMAPAEFRDAFAEAKRLGALDAPQAAQAQATRATLDEGRRTLTKAKAADGQMDTSAEALDGQLAQLEQARRRTPRAPCQAPRVPCQALGAPCQAPSRSLSGPIAQLHTSSAVSLGSPTC